MAIWMSAGLSYTKCRLRIVCCILFLTCGPFSEGFASGVTIAVLTILRRLVWRSSAQVDMFFKL